MKNLYYLEIIINKEEKIINTIIILKKIILFCMKRNKLYMK